MKKLVVFGDSWPYGCDLHPNEKTFGQLIAEELGYEYLLFAEPETSIDNMILQLNRFIKQKNTDDCIALFCLTAPSRSLYFSNGPKITSVMWDGPKQNDIVSQAYYRHIHSDELDFFRLTQSLIVLQSLCQQHNIIDCYVNSFSKINWEALDLVGVDMSRIYQQGKESFLDFFGCSYVDPSNEYFQGSAAAHPNQRGHKLIAEKLSTWINYISTTKWHSLI